MVMKKTLIFTDNILTKELQYDKVKELFLAQEGHPLQQNVVELDKLFSYNEHRDFVENSCRDLQPEVVIGCNVAACYVEMVRGLKAQKILVNPIVKVSYIKPSDNLTWIKENVLPLLFKDITDDDRENTYAIFGGSKQEESWHGTFIQHYPNVISFPMRPLNSEWLTINDVLGTIQMLME